MDRTAVVLRAVERLHEGHSVLIFPEGTRSPEHGLGRFRPGAFAICHRAKVPAVFVLISCDPPTSTKELHWYIVPKKTVRYEIQQLQTLSPELLSGDAHETARAVQQSFQENLDAQRGAARRQPEASLAH